MNTHLHITIPSEKVSQLIGFFVEKAIPFQMQYSVKQHEANSQQYSIGNHTEELPLTSHPHTSDDERINALSKKYLLGNFDKKLPSIKEIAAEYEISVGGLNNFFQQAYGKPFYQVYQSNKMEYAAKLLKKGYKCNDVTVMVGYSENAAIKFNKMFQKHFGITPKKYQMEHYGRIDRR